MPLINAVRQTVLRCDLLSAQPTLRVRGQSAYESLTGGLLSIVIMVAFVSIFAGSFLNVLNKVQISSVITSTNEVGSLESIQDIKFALSIQKVNLTQIQSIFKITLWQTWIDPVTWTQYQQIPLSQCTIDYWDEFVNDPWFRKIFTWIQMDSMLCPPKQRVTLKSYEGSFQYQNAFLTIERCQNSSTSSVVCNTTAEIDAYMQNFEFSYDHFIVNLYTRDALISPEKDNPITYNLESDLYTTFTRSLGSYCDFIFARYEIETDNSILPYKQIEQQTGSFVSEFEAHTIGIVSDSYLTINIKRTMKQLKIERKVTKLDEMLSYVGGLFGLLFAVIAFVLSSFNEYRYELYVAEGCFRYDESGRQIEESSFGIWAFLKYSLYDWLRLFGCEIKWKEMNEIEQTRDQINEQLDTKHLMARIKCLEKSLELLLTKHQRSAVHLIDLPTLSETTSERKLIEVSEKLISKRFQGNDSKQANKNSISPLDNPKISHNFEPQEILHGLEDDFNHDSSFDDKFKSEKGTLNNSTLQRDELGIIPEDLENDSSLDQGKQRSNQHRGKIQNFETSQELLDIENKEEKPSEWDQDEQVLLGVIKKHYEAIAKEGKSKSIKRRKTPSEILKAMIHEETKLQLQQLKKPANSESK